MRTFSKNLAIANRVDQSLERSFFYSFYFEGQPYNGALIGFLSIPEAQPMYLSTVEVVFQDLPKEALTLKLMKTTTAHTGSSVVLDETEFTGNNSEEVELLGNPVTIPVGVDEMDIRHEFGLAILLSGGYKYFFEVETSATDTISKGQGLNVILGTVLS